VTPIIVSSSMVTKHRNGGEPWVRLSWVLGLRRLGFDAYFVEQIGPDRCVDAAGVPAALEDSDNLVQFRCITERFGLQGKTALIATDESAVYGMSRGEVLDLARDAALLVNITGHLTLPSLRDRIQKAAFVDEDPGFTQFWYVTGQSDHLARHSHYFTVGLNIGWEGCSIPTGGITWHPLRQPVVLDTWPVTREGSADRFTTVGGWRGAYGTVTYGEHTFRQRAHEFRRFFDLPGRTGAEFELALDIHPADQRDLDALHEHGWRTVDPQQVAGDPAAFQRFVQTSGAEFAVAQGVYVETHSGWFSDRSVRYLASGKPILVQDTGIGRVLPVGEGVLTFSNVDGAVRGVRDITEHYDRHAAAARTIAEQYFDSDVVLSRVAEITGVAP
jgi:hypothetical protein